jgi:hypothetical protein
MELLANQGTIVKYGSSLLAVFSIVCGFVKIFVPGFYVGALMGALVIITICLLILAGQWVSLDVLKYFELVKYKIGLGLLFIIVGALFAGLDDLAIACWVINWFGGVVLIGLGFIGGESGVPSSSWSRPPEQVPQQDPYASDGTYG